MPKFPGVPHLRAVNALEKAGFVVIRQGKHIILCNGLRTVQVPRNNPVWRKANLRSFMGVEGYWLRVRR